MRTRGLPFVTGHGTENDFVLLPDPDGALELTPRLIRRLCDRRAGIGADGVLRVVRTAVCPEVAHLAGEAEWFMDYRNADGSTAEMCGNGVRVYVRYLVSAGLVDPGPLPVATRNGVRQTVLDPVSGEVTVDLGSAVLGTRPVSVELAGRFHDAVAVDLGNPHLVVLLATPVERLDLTRPPIYPPREFPAGANVELVNVLRPGHLVMRVVERGVGETRSCGTGAAAAALAAGAGLDWLVDVPGGRLRVSTVEPSIRLTGPAVLVAEGTILPEWLADDGRGTELG